MAMRLLVAYIAILLIMSASALTSGEVEALESLFSTFPDLGRVGPFNRFGEYPYNHEDLGGSWKSPFEDICESGTGYKIHGVHCSLDGRIDRILFTDAWGYNASETSISLAGLTEVTNFTDISTTPLGTDLLLSLLQVTNISTLRINSVLTPQIEAALQPLKLLQLRAYIPGTFKTNSYTFLTHLEQLQSGVRLLIHNLGSLRYFSGHAIFKPAQFYLVQDLMLESFECSCMIDRDSQPPRLSWVSPPTLKNLDLRITPSLNQDPIEAFHLETCEKLENFTVISENSVNVSIGHCPRLRSFSTNLEIVEGNEPFFLPSLESISLVGIANRAWQSQFSVHRLETEFGTLKRVRMDNWIPSGSSDLIETLCALVNPSHPNRNLTSLTIRDMTFPTTWPIELPSCLREATDLLSLDLGNSGSANHYNATALLAVAPVSLKSLTLRGAIGTVTSKEDFSGWLRFLYSMEGLEVLELSNMPVFGEMPDSFVSLLPALRSLTLSQLPLSGAVPTLGWQNLQSMVIIDCLHTEFPIFSKPAQNLELLHLQLPLLASLPSDETFMGMTELKSFYLSSNVLNGPIPNWWATHSKIETISILAPFQGSLPASITSPRLSSITISSNGSLCGTLPDFEPDTVLRTLDLGGNKLQDAIPFSWQSLSITKSLILDNNHLVGSVAGSFLRHHLTALETLSLANTELSGATWDLSQAVSLQTISLSNTFFDVCSNDPRIQNYRGNTTECFLDGFYDNGPCSCLWFWTGCVNLLPSCAPPPPEYRFTRNEPFTCITPTPGGPTIGNCPLPSPSPAHIFFCHDGVWVTNSSVIQPTVIVPGGAKIEIHGNLTINSSITFEDVNSAVQVNGCIFLQGGSVVILELTEEEVILLSKDGKTIERVLLKSLNGNTCPDATDLTNTQVQLKKKGDWKRCRKVKVVDNKSSRDSLAIAFKIDNSTCNMIIIIPSVFGAIVIFVAIAAVVGYLLYKKKMKLSS